VKFRGLKLGWHVAGMKENRNYTEFWWGNFLVNIPFHGRDENMIAIISI
jgi:hypothetical protein